MKIAFINTFNDGGGAAIAAKRIKKAIDTSYQYGTSFISLDGLSFVNRKLYLLRLIFEKLPLLFSLKNRKDLYKFSLAKMGVDISKDKRILEADVIHIHWVNNGFLSLNSLKKIFELKKPIVWTMHDMWSFTAACHYNNGCMEYKSTCSNCIYTKNDSHSKNIFKLKQKLYENANITFVGCSNWITEAAKLSNLLIGKKVLTINNPIEISKDLMTNKSELRAKYKIPQNKFVLMFSAANILDTRKGFSILVDSLSKINNDDIFLLVIGVNKENVDFGIKNETNFVGFVSDLELLKDYYRLSDLFACPSLEDNLPNTILESLACGTPSIAFNIGGISDLIIDSQNGILVDFDGDRIENFGNGIELAKNKKFHSQEIIQGIAEKFSYESIAKRYVDLYKSLLN
jgi:glycosyltransferase involved in cell wall biosynthesis